MDMIIFHGQALSDTRVRGGKCGVFALFYLNEKTKKGKFFRDKHFARQQVQV